MFPTLRMAMESSLRAAGNRRRLGGYHPTTHAPTPATCAGQYGMDLAGSEGSSVDEPYLVVAWPRGVLARSSRRCLPLRGDNDDGVSPGIDRKSTRLNSSHVKISY